MTKRFLSLILGPLLALGSAACGGTVEDEPEHSVRYETATGEEVEIHGEDEDEIEEGMENVEDHLEERQEIREDAVEERYDD